MAVLNDLPEGYRFSPTDKELINHFLRLKITGNEDAVSDIREVNLCKWEPWDLPALSVIESKDDKWIFFCPRDCKYKNGKRSSRATEAGHWKATGKDRSIKLGTIEIGTKKTLVFYSGRAPKDQRTHWVIHEYCATSKELDGTNPEQGSFVLFKLIKKDDKKLGKKQNESTDCSNCNKVEENVSSPAAVISFMPSEVVVTPTISAHAAMLPSSSKSCLDENSDGTTLDTPLPIESFNNSFVADDAGDESNVQLYFDPEELIYLLDPIPEPLDFLGKITSPLHLQMLVSLNELPLGYRFSPTDKELVNHFLRLKITGKEDAVSDIREVDLCKWEPWDLPAMSLIETKDDKWIFFCPKICKYKNGKRSSRTTKAGYWKATGNDRSIKLGKTKIGMKKTLVFHNGRAPKGQRTHWVIHEYCATSEELDGTNPGQGSFVLFKLIKKDDKKLGKKQDASTDCLDWNRVEGNVSSPVTVTSFMPPEVVVSPTISVQPAELPSSSKSCLDENSEDGTTLDTPLPVESFNNSFVVDDPGDESNVQPDFDPEVWRHLPELIPESLDFLGHLQMQSELESLNHLYCHASNNVGPDHNGVLFPCGTNEQYMTDYLASVLDTSHEQTCEDSGCYKNLAVESEALSYVNLIEWAFDKDTGSCSKADAEAAQAQTDHEQFEQNSERRAPGCMARTPEISNEEHLSPEGSSNAVSNGDTFGTGITLRSRQRHDQPSVNNVGPQGTAPRRIRLLKLQVQSSYHSNFGDLGSEQEDHEAKLVVAEAEEAEEKHSVAADPSAIIDETKVAQEPGWNMKSISDFPRGGDKEVPSASLKAPPALHSISSSIHMLWVLLAVGLSIVFVGLGRFFEF